MTPHYHEENFLEIPEPIRLWFGSEEATDAIGAILESFSIPPETRRIIPETIWKLETKQLPPETFTETLREELGTERERAIEIARALYDTLLFPLRSDLLAFGIAIEAVDRGEGGGATSPSATAPGEPVAAPEKTTVKPTHTPAPSPFILHREERVKSVSEERELPPTLPRRPLFRTERSSAIKPTGSVVARLDYAGRDTAERKAKKPLKVSFPAKKLVHYSNLRTPTNPFGNRLSEAPETRKESTNNEE